MLSGEKRRWRHDRHLLAAHGHNKCSAQRHLGLAEANVAADQPVHGFAGRQILQHIAYGYQLVFSFFVGEASAELIEDAMRRIDGIGRLGGALRSNSDQAFGHFAQTYLGSGLACLPSGFPSRSRITPSDSEP